LSPSWRQRRQYFLQHDPEFAPRQMRARHGPAPKAQLAAETPEIDRQRVGEGAASLPAIGVEATIESSAFMATSWNSMSRAPSS